MPAGQQNRPFLPIFIWFLCLSAAWPSPPVYAQTFDAGAVSRDILKSLPSIEKPAAPSAQATESGQAEKETASTAASKEAIPIWESERDLPEEQLLATPLQRLYLNAPLGQKEIYDYLRKNFAGRERIGSKDLQAIRSTIWGLYLQHGRLAHVSFRLSLGNGTTPSSLSVHVAEIKVRSVVTVPAKDVAISPDLQNQIKSLCTDAFAKGQILNLEQVDAQIKHRLRLGDYDLHVALEPVDPTHVDLIVTIGGKPAEAPSYLLQYDNTGVRSFGKDRLLAGVAVNQLALPGDHTEILALKTLDIGRGDLHGVIFGRGEYTFPVSSWGIRLGGWVSGLSYDAVKGTTADSEQNGTSFETGLKATRPLYTGKNLMLDNEIDLLGKWERDKFDADTVTADKTAQSLWFKTSGTYVADKDRFVSANVGFAGGHLDLSGNASSLAQDKVSAKTQGFYGKAVMDSEARTALTTDGQLDLRGKMRGQIAFKNLDSMEKFTLGGSTGLQAFSSGEASGDHGLSGNLEVGYFLLPGLRCAAFYEAGAIWQSFNPWTNQNTPNNYALQDMGLSLSQSYKSLDVALTFAHQIGPNPGLSASGTDSDNVSRRYRVLTTLSYRY